MVDDIDAAGKLAVLGFEQLPGGSLVTGMVRMFLPPNADERLRQAIEEDASNQLIDLQTRVSIIEKQLATEGKKLDQPGAIRTTMLAHRMAEAFGSAYSDVKRDAVANAAARQFDPRMGEQGARKYWFDRVAQLSDLQVWALQLLREHTLLYYVPSGQLLLGKEAIPSPLPESDQVSLGTALSHLALPEDRMRNPAPLVSSMGEGLPLGNYNVTPEGLTVYGRILVQFIAPIGG